ncbi:MULTISPECIES: DsbA family protein [Cohnella]|uniref:DsbA family protein n=1 Tax=Cohnella TaxID=329857 RepID=UPI0009BBBD37|nr:MULTISPECIES: thioredoxin domain-containing protein [Cohnella]MBN2983336.1 DsbA family protein [Cohnella algarum]
MDKSQRKATTKKIRQEQQRKKQQRMRIIIWATVVCFIALVVAAILLKPEPKPIAINYNGAPTIGSESAPIKIVEFGDFKCIACKYFSEEIMPKLKAEYIDTGKVSFSFQNFTIFLPDSYTAALAGQAVFHQSNEEFWKFYDAVFEHQQDERIEWATSEFLVNLAKEKELNINYDKLKQDIDSQTYSEEVDNQVKIAKENRFTGTPTILINGRKLDDSTALNYDNLKKEIDKILNEMEK